VIDATTDAPQETRRITMRAATTDDRPPIKAFLSGHGLPTKGVGLKKHIGSYLLAQDADGRIVALGGISIHRDGALLRALAVHHRWRSINLAKLLVDQLGALAQQHGAADLYVVTSTAPGYFKKLGFVETVPSSVPDDVRSAKVFSAAALAHAVVLYRAIPAKES
jgi:amino-acid N-acetyltransferase